MAASEATNGIEEQPTSSTPTSSDNENSTSPMKTGTPVKDENKNLAVNFLLQGKRHLVVKDFHAAIESLGESCRLLSENNPETATNPDFDSAEAHFFYGKALLEQSRLELGVLEGPELGKVEGASDEDDSEEEEEEKSDDDEEEEAEEGNASTNEPREAESSEATANGTSEVENVAKSSGSATPQESAVSSSIESGKKKISIVGEIQESEVDLNAPSPSVTSGTIVDNEQPSTSSGLTAEAVEEKQAEEELSNLELAWEVLEVAKIGYRALLNEISVSKGAFDDKTEEDSKKKLLEKEKLIKKRLADTHCSLGEVATESENYNQAIDEFKTGLEILNEIEGSDSREIAQYYFQMGLAYSFDKKFPEAISSFKKSVEIIETRITTLKFKIENKQTAKDLGVELEDPSKTEADEVQELTALLPELQEKITDTIDAEKESQAMEEEEQKEQEIILRNSPVKNPNPPTANDISHLVKKKKRAEDAPAEQQPPTKKICTEVVAPSAIATESAVAATTNGNGEGPAPAEPASAAPAPTTNGHAIQA